MHHQRQERQKYDDQRRSFTGFIFLYIPMPQNAKLVCRNTLLTRVGLGDHALVPVLRLDSGKVRDVITHPAVEPARFGMELENRVGIGYVNVVESVIRFPSLVINRKAIGCLNVISLAVGDRCGDRQVLVLYVCKLRNDFRSFTGPDEMRGCDPLVVLRAPCVDPVAIRRPARLQSVEAVGQTNRLTSQARELLLSPASPARLMTLPRPLPTPTL